VCWGRDGTTVLFADPRRAELEDIPVCSPPRPPSPPPFAKGRASRDASADRVREQAHFGGRPLTRSGAAPRGAGLDFAGVCRALRAHGFGVAPPPTPFSFCPYASPYRTASALPSPVLPLHPAAVSLFVTAFWDVAAPPTSLPPRLLRESRCSVRDQEILTLFFGDIKEVEIILLFPILLFLSLAPPLSAPPPPAALVSHGGDFAPEFHHPSFRRDNFEGINRVRRSPSAAFLNSAALLTRAPAAARTRRHTGSARLRSSGSATRGT
jgi:hypothetical protein